MVRVASRSSDAKRGLCKGPLMEKNAEASGASEPPEAPEDDLIQTRSYVCMMTPADPHLACAMTVGSAMLHPSAHRNGSLVAGTDMWLCRRRVVFSVQVRSGR
jgi:hypothetical protein